MIGRLLVSSLRCECLGMSLIGRASISHGVGPLSMNRFGTDEVAHSDRHRCERDDHGGWGGSNLYAMFMIFGLEKS